MIAHTTGSLLIKFPNNQSDHVVEKVIALDKNLNKNVIIVTANTKVI